MGRQKSSYLLFWLKVILFFVIILLSAKVIQGRSYSSYRASYSSYRSYTSYRAPTYRAYTYRAYTYRAPTYRAYTYRAYTYRAPTYRAYSYRAYSSYRSLSRYTRFYRSSTYRAIMGAYFYYYYSRYFRHARLPGYRSFSGYYSVYGSVCTNYEANDNHTYLGRFKCPLSFEPSNATKCCGNSGTQFCCDPTFSSSFSSKLYSAGYRSYRSYSYYYCSTCGTTSNRVNVGGIIGGVIGGIIILGAIVAGIFICMKSGSSGTVWSRSATSNTTLSSTISTIQPIPPSYPTQTYSNAGTGQNFGYTNQVVQYSTNHMGAYPPPQMYHPQAQTNTGYSAPPPSYDNVASQPMQYGLGPGNTASQPL